MHIIWKLTLTHLRMYSRDRQSLFFALVFPLIFMLALGYMVDNDELKPIDIGVVINEGGEANSFFEAFADNPLIEAHAETEAEARAAFDNGERDAVIFAPEAALLVEQASRVPVKVLVNISQPQQAAQVQAVLRSVFVDMERQMRGTEELFALEVEDIDAREARYVDFLIPGLVALMVMQLSIAGSGFNIVEYKRKGILKRLFVTPLRPIQFIASLILSRLAIILGQITFMLIVGELVFDISIEGSVLLMYVFAALGSVLFLGLGFALGGIANSQNAVMMVGNLVIFPQIFLAGVFFPLDSLPAWLQPVASVLPLHFVSSSIRAIANEGATVAMLTTDLLGILIWMVVGVFLAVRLFKWGEGVQ